MGDKLVTSARVNYGDVDRRERMLLPRVFKLLQDAAIAHANRFGTGPDAMDSRGETWMLGRIAATIERYPHVGETLRVETWSNGINGFKGSRDFRVYDGEERVVVAASSLWLYVNVRKQSIVRVPAEIAATFPVCAEGMWCPEIESLVFDPPAAEARVVVVSLRYGDFDLNQHVNNAAYLDLVQTALVRSGLGAYPREIRLKFAKAIPVAAADVEVRIDPCAVRRARFRIERAGVVFAQGEALEISE